MEAPENGKEDQDRAFGHEFHLMIAELGKSGHNDTAPARSLPGKRSRTRTLVVAGYGTMASPDEAPHSGLGGGVTEPVTPGQIAGILCEALASREVEPEADAQPERIREVLRLASSDDLFGNQLLFEGTRALAEVPIASEAKAAIVSGDIAWIQEECGELCAEERPWLAKRLEAELW